MKKITCFICSMGSGGAEHQMAELTSMLVQKGYAVDLVTFGNGDDHYPIDSCVRRIRIANANNKFLKFLQIFWFFVTHPMDCVISFSQRANLLALLPLLFRPKVKVIAGERNFTVSESDTIEKILFKYLYKRANFIVPNSYSQGEHICAKQATLADKVVTIINYTNTDQYTYTPPSAASVIRIGVFCRYDKQKNYERFAKVVKRLKESGGVMHIDWYGNIKDSNGNQNTDYLKFSSLVEQYGIADLIQLNNHIKNVKEIMPSYDVLCVPSLYEGWSNTISEGICCGRPMLVSDVSDNARMVIHQENGFLFDPTDENSMYEAFVELFATTVEDRIRMGEKSRALACELFNADKFVNDYIALIDGK